MTQRAGFTQTEAGQIFETGARDERLRVVAALREMAEASTDHAFPEVLRRSILRELAEFFEKGGHR